MGRGRAAEFNSAAGRYSVRPLHLPDPSELKETAIGLLALSTGGLNGSLADVTGELPTLGLNSVVWAALANATWGSSGTFGDPVSLAISTFLAPAGGVLVPDFDLFGVLTSAWNTVSGAVVTGLAYIAHGIEGLFAAAWNAVVAVATYLAQIGRALVRFAETAVAATVSALKAVGGGALLYALSVAVRAIEAAVGTFVNAFMVPLERAAGAYMNSIISSTQQVFGAMSALISGTGSFTQTATAIALFFLSVPGLGSFAQSFGSAMSRVFSYLEPVLKLFDPTALLAFLAGLFGGSGNAASSIESSVSGLATGVFSALFGAASALLSATGLSSKSVPSPTEAPIPSPSNLSAFANDSASSSGDSTLATSVGPILGDPGPLTVLGVARVAFSVAVMIILLTGAARLYPEAPWTIAFAPFIPIARALNIAFVDIPVGALVIMSIGMLISILGLFVPHADTSLRLFLGLLGVSLATMLFVFSLVKVPHVFSQPPPRSASAAERDNGICGVAELGISNCDRSGTLKGPWCSPLPMEATEVNTNLVSPESRPNSAWPRVVAVIIACMLGGWGLGFAFFVSSLPLGRAVAAGGLLAIPAILFGTLVTWTTLMDYVPPSVTIHPDRIEGRIAPYQATRPWIPRVLGRR